MTTPARAARASRVLLGVGAVLRARELSEVGAVALAAIVAAAAWRSFAVPLWLAISVLIVGALTRRACIVVAGLALLASCLGAWAVAGAVPPGPGGLQGQVTVVRDPVVRGGAVEADVRTTSGDRFAVRGRGAAAVALRDRLAGERIEIEGRITPRRPDQDWLLRRHIIGTVDLDRSRFVDAGDPASRAANAFRRRLSDGAASLPVEEHALFTGFVYGDDRSEPGEVVDDFRAAGLSHLLAVSGQNVTE